MLAEEFLAGAPAMEAPLSPDATEAHPDARVLAVAYSDPVTPSVLEAFPRLEAVVTRSDGYEHLPADWMQERGIPGYHLGDYAVPAVAEFTLMALVALLRRVPEGAARTRAGGWDRRGLAGRGLRDVTVGVIGTGRIGSEVVRRLVALGGDVIGYDIEPDPELDALAGFRYVATADDLFERSDALTVHVPLTGATEGLVDAHALGRLPPGAVVVNTARGRVVDQEAVERLLRDGHLTGYAADVLPGEPSPPDVERFRDLENVLLTPHLAAYDRGTLRERYARTATIARAILTGSARDVQQWQCVAPG